MVQLQDVHVAHGHRAVEGIARATVEKRDLPTAREPRGLQHVLDLDLGRAVEYRRRERNAVLEVARELEHVVVGKLPEVFLLARRVVDLLEELADLGGAFLRLQHFRDA